MVWGIAFQNTVEPNHLLRIIAFYGYLILVHSIFNTAFYSYIPKIFPFHSLFSFIWDPVCDFSAPDVLLSPYEE